MNFQNLKVIEDADHYLDVSFRKAKKSADLMREKIVSKNRLHKSKELELHRIGTVRNTLAHNLENILKSFPSIDQLPVFYLELIKSAIDYRDLKKSLGALNWAVKRISSLFSHYQTKIKRTKDLTAVNSYRREFYGRVSSVMKQIKTELKFLEQSRKIMRDFPTIKTSVFTAAIAGFPNVGKTTLLYKLSGSRPEIKSYAFTTKSLNVAYLRDKKRKIQLVDTPGTLNRFDKMNKIEQQAYLAIKHCADLVVYVFDPTESYPMEDQEKLYRTLCRAGKDVYVYVSKSDIADASGLATRYSAYTDPKALKKVLLKLHGATEKGSRSSHPDSSR